MSKGKFEMRKPLPAGLLKTILFGALGYFLAAALYGIAAHAREAPREHCATEHHMSAWAEDLEASAREELDIGLREQTLKEAMRWRREADRVLKASGCGA